MPIVLIASLIAFQVLLIFVHLTVYATMSAAFGFDGAIPRLIFIVLGSRFSRRHFSSISRGIALRSGTTHFPPIGSVSYIFCSWAA